MEYKIDYFHYVPILIPGIYADNETLYFHYLEQKDNIFSNMAGKRALYGWVQKGPKNPRVLRTTGDYIAYYSPTGKLRTANKVNYEDIVRLQYLFDKDGMPENNRYLMMPEQMYSSLFGEKGKATYFKGFHIIKRNQTPKYENYTNTVWEYDTAGEKLELNFEDSLSCIAWHSSAVGYAIGKVKVSEKIDSSKHKGSLVSIAVEFGAGHTRENGVGVYSLIEGRKNIGIVN
jgi:hypothetical protein